MKTVRLRYMVGVLLLCAAQNGYSFTFNGKSSEQLGGSAETHSKPAASTADKPKKPKGEFTINGESIGSAKKPKPAKPSSTTQAKHAPSTESSTHSTASTKASSNKGILGWLFGDSKKPKRSSNQAAFTGKLNLNTASAAQLTQIKGIGPAKAAAIVAYRRSHGDFSSISELTEVKGLGAATVAKIKPHLTLN